MGALEERRRKAMRRATGIAVGGLSVLGLGLGCNAILDLKPGIGRCEDVTCPAADACHMAGTCDPFTGKCSNPEAPTRTSCDDGDACTRTSTCKSGACVGQDPVDCAALDPCHPGTCDPATGCSNNPAATDGTPCDDGSLCTRTDTCQGGTCTGKDQVECSVKDACHLDECDPKAGCVAAPDETPCNDGSVCTATDTCQAGKCNPSGDHTWAHWDLNSAPPSPRYVHNADVVFDKLTGLLWQRVAPEQAFDWKGAKDYCATLKTIPGYPSGWRLPTRIELVSIVDYSTFDPAIDSTAFLGTIINITPDSFWSSSPTPSTNIAWSVYFGGGDVIAIETNNNYRVRCVR